MIAKAIKYGTPGCGICEMVEKNLKTFGLEVVSVNLEENEDLIESKNIQSVPFVEMYNEFGEIVMTFKGLKTVENLRQILEECK